MKKKTNNKPLNTWVDSSGRLFANVVSCMGLNAREIEARRFEQCPCLQFHLLMRSPQAIIQELIIILQYLSQNKLAELMELLRQRKSLFVNTQRPEDADSMFSWFSKKPLKTQDAYDKDAEFRARLRALIQYLRSINRYEPFDSSLPELPVPEGVSWFQLNAPIYIFMRNWGWGISARIMFPSMSKDGMPLLNYDNLGKAHRWVERMMGSGSYVGGSKCEMACTTTPEIFTKYRFAFPRCKRNRIFMPCGHINTKPKKDEKLDSYVAYHVNLSHPSIAPFFSKSRIKSLLYNILPSEWEMYPGPRYALVSENRKYQLILMPTLLGVFKDVSWGKRGMSGRYMYGIRFKGISTKVSIESGVLTIYGVDPSSDNDDILFRLELNQGGQMPMALYLHDNGKLSLFDGNNVNVLNFDKFNALLDRSEEEMILQGYDPDLDYRERIIRLLHWLKARNLISSMILPNDDRVLKALKIEYEDLRPDSEFNPAVNYEERVYALINMLRVTYPNMPLPSMSTLQSKFTRPQIAYEDEGSLPPYDPTKANQDRVSQLRAQNSKIE